MGLRPSSIVRSVLTPPERRRVLDMAPFKPSLSGPEDDHLIRLGILRPAGTSHTTLTRAGRVTRRLLQELEACSASA